jgi:ribosomal protein L34E
MGEPTGFSYRRRKSGEIVISHNGRHATTLRGSKAERFLNDVATRDPQQVMARITGNYKRGNEPR